MLFPLLQYKVLYQMRHYDFITEIDCRDVQMNIAPYVIMNKLHLSLLYRI